jgi:hypothetical protein
MTHDQVALRAGKKAYRSDEAVPAEGLAFSPLGFQIVHRPYSTASFGGWLPQREVIESLMFTIKFERAAHRENRESISFTQNTNKSHLRGSADEH